MSKIAISLPETGLTPSISVLNMATEVQNFSGTMNEIGSSRVYVYEFTEVSGTDYAYVITTTGYETVSGALFYEATGGGGGGLTAEQAEQLARVDSNVDVKVSTIHSGGGGFSINYGAINTHTTNKVNELREELTKSNKTIAEGFNDTKSHIDLAKDDINSKIDSIEIPEAILEEKEAKKAVKLITTLDKKFTTYVESEMAEKEEIDAISQTFTKLEMESELKRKMEEEEKRKKEAEEKKKEEEEDKKELKLIQEVFDKIEAEEKEKKKKELEQELEELEMEKKEKEKELNSLS